MVESKFKLEKAPEIKPDRDEAYHAPENGAVERSAEQTTRLSDLTDSKLIEGESLSGPAPAVLPMGTVYRQVESILEDGLADVYFTLPLAKQKVFKAEGEKTARAIIKILGRSKIKVKKIINLIVSWLKIIPGINRFFLEQEAKIKADRILEAAAFGREKNIR